jgi:hypothetical protein
MTFSREKTPAPTVVEPIQTVSFEPAPYEPTQTAPVEPSETTPVEAAQTVPAEQTIHNGQPPSLQKNNWAKALEKLRKRETAASEAERRVEFNRFWDNLRSIPSPSVSSEASSH